MTKNSTTRRRSVRRKDAAPDASLCLDGVSNPVLADEGVFSNSSTTTSSKKSRTRTRKAKTVDTIATLEMPDNQGISATSTSESDASSTMLAKRSKRKTTSSKRKTKSTDASEVLAEREFQKSIAIAHLAANHSDERKSKRKSSVSSTAESGSPRKKSGSVFSFIMRKALSEIVNNAISGLFED
ncbi:MAG: hypothetical protein RMM16_04445 [Chloroherpetonaceae bacterium]|nr:hypothetical protein [Chloroherpetonaceae bacterium]